MPGAPLFTIEADGDYRLEALADESHLPAIRVGQQVSVSLDSVDHRIDARVSEIVPAVDAASRAYTVKTVSYTHLDVYKRQTEGATFADRVRISVLRSRSEFCLVWPSATCATSGATMMSTIATRNFIRPPFLSGHPPVAPRPRQKLPPVSYTHLDVYKRQDLRR